MLLVAMGSHRCGGAVCARCFSLFYHTGAQAGLNGLEDNHPKVWRTPTPGWRTPGGHGYPAKAGLEDKHPKVWRTPTPDWRTPGGQTPHKKWAGGQPQQAGGHPHTQLEDTWRAQIPTPGGHRFPAKHELEDKHPKGWRTTTPGWRTPGGHGFPAKNGLEVTRPVGVSKV